ncbi:uncharacterized protein LOC127118845 isoform X3 [Lathyrus oleraceus]|uniref:uncharacterized protein LOC127118845 isoform X3 n=1 Tax=Pisum sativum TaxID=3888 RepID=UPI0021D30276|nr:uncharacterized protein LOC127118845 isoform X3 [Pisum sativum]
MLNCNSLMLNCNSMWKLLICCRFDYIARDCRACGLDATLSFRDLTIHKLFATRADMYRTVYTHPKVKAMELMHLCKEMIICRFQIPFKIQLNTGRL